MVDRTEDCGDWTIPLEGVQSTEALARQLAPMLGRGSAIALSGDLGSGKTVFARAVIQSLCRNEGIAADEVPSPTYTLVQPYRLTDLTVFHFDLYRLSSADEAIELAIEDAFEDGICLIEWAERASEFLPRDCLRIRFDFTDNQSLRLAHISCRSCHQAAAVRNAAIDFFLASHGWTGANRQALAADASFRTYERVLLSGRNAILMDAHAEKRPVPAFIHVARTLDAIGLSAPKILAQDVENGLVLLEDFGDGTFTRLLDSGTDPECLYNLATDVLVALHERTALPPSGIPSYSDRLLLEEAELLTRWYLPAVTGERIPGPVREEYLEIWRQLLPLARSMPSALVLRDYHVDNLIRLPGRAGTAACGLLDFQDAVIGPVSYDFVSLVEDARRDVPSKLKADVRARYLAAFPELDAELFDLSCAVLGAQRHCKVLGIFTRLRDRDGKPGYLVHVPRLWRLLEQAILHPRLKPLRTWLDRHIPADRRVVPPAGSRS